MDTIFALQQSANNNLESLFTTASLFFASYRQLFTTLGLLILLTVVVLTLGYTALKLYLLKQKITSQYILFEVQPLRVTTQSPLTTQQLFNLIHGLARQLSFIDRLLGASKNYSFEIVSTRNQGIRYLIRTPSTDAGLLKKSLLAYLPGISIKETNDYLPDTKSTNSRVTEYALSGHFAFPLGSQQTLEKHDPIAYTTGSMTKLNDNELVSFQIVATPTNKSSVPDIKRISNLIYSEKDLVNSIRQSYTESTPALLLKQVVFVLLQILLLPIGLLVLVATAGKEGPFLATRILSTPQKTSNPYQEELEGMIKNKLDQQLFTTSLRLLVASNNKSEMYSKERGFASALSSFANSGYQAIIPTLRIKLDIIHKLKHFVFKHRLILPFSQNILSSSEMGDIYHLPFTSTTKTEDLIKQHSKELPAPVALKRTQDLDVIFARNTYGGSSTNIGLSLDERRRHMYILGATGTGKSTMLLSMINQDMRNNKGLAVIDPHGDLIDQILQLVPKARIKDVVYFNPDDIAYPMGINLLELTPNLPPEDALREREFITESVISLFHKIYSEKYSGPRMEYILRNTIHTAFTIPNATLFTVYKLLINTKYRKSVVRNIKHENLKDFWKYEFAKAGDYQKVKMISPITNKIGRFLFSPSAKRILEQEKSTVDFDEVINDGKILLCNVSKGKIGEDNSELFGVVIMTKLQLAALKRARLPMEQRKDFYMYVDEFQNFATQAFAQILSEARKYRLGAILAHQTTSQLEDSSLVHVTLANTGTVVCFRTANPEDERLILPQFRPHIEQGEIASLPSYRFYMRLGALNPEEPFSGITVPVDTKYNPQRAEEVIESSRKFFTKRYQLSNIYPTKYTLNKTKKTTSNNQPSSVLP